MIMIQANKADDKYMDKWLRNLTNISDEVDVLEGIDIFTRRKIYSWDKETEKEGINQFMNLHKEKDLWIRLEDDMY